MRLHTLSITQPLHWIAVVFVAVALLGYQTFLYFASHPSVTIRRGALTQDETWSGVVRVESPIQIPKTITLTIQPGTMITFVPTSGLEIHGKLVAVGTPDEQIQFTSDATAPQDGDWSGISLIGTSNSEIQYSIVEFGQSGIRLQESNARIGHSILRWNRGDGLFATSSSTPTIEYNRIYQNGGNGINIEGSDRAMARYNYIENSGEHGLRNSHSTTTVELNIFRRNQGSGIFLESESAVTARGNTLAENRKNQILCGGGQNHLTATTNAVVGVQPRVNCPKDAVVKNTYGKGITGIGFDYPNVKRFDFGKTPGVETHPPASTTR
ncbi:MAG: right-handed parallel beta-helix repeat-containing protein [Patescibacteria group bacterium]